MFDTYYGHHDIKKQFEHTLRSAGLSGMTYLFYGPLSIGKRTGAFFFSKKLLCLRDMAEDCTCRSCTAFGVDHPDFRCIGQTKGIKVSDVEDLLEFSNLYPFMSNRKVIVLDNADQITQEAANRLLKAVEEPKDFLFYILVTSNPESLLPTVRARCIEFRFSTLSAEDTINILWKRMGFELDKARVLGWMAEKTSLDVFSQAGTCLSCRTMALEFLSGIKPGSIVESWDFLDKVDRSSMSLFSDMIVMLLTDILMLCYKLEDIINSDLRKELGILAEGWGLKKVLACVSQYNQVKKDAHLNVNLNAVMKRATYKAVTLLGG